MSMGRIEVDSEPGVYVSGARARWLLQARRAQLTSAGKLQILHGRAHADGSVSGGGLPGEERVIWSAFSSSGVRNLSGTRWLRGYHMNGDAVNRG